LPRQELSRVLAAFENQQGAVLHGAAGAGKTHLGRRARVVLEQRTGDEELLWYAVAGSRDESTIPLAAVDALTGDLEAGSAPPRRFARVVHERLLAEAAGRSVAIQVEDAHLLDGDSAELLAHLCRLGEISLLIMTRSTTSPALVRLWRDGLLARVDIPALSAREVETLLGEALGGPVDASLVREVMDASDGNAMMVHELVRAGVASSAIVPLHGMWVRAERAIPDARLVDVVRSEVDQLTGDERDIVELIALAEPLALATARHLVDPTVLDRLTASGLVRVDQGMTVIRVPIPVLRLPQPAYAECVRLGIAPSRRRALLDTVYGSRVETAHQTIAGHQRWASWTLECGLDVAPAELVDAARSASTIGQYEAAIDFATAALDRTDDPVIRIEAHAIRARELRFLDRPVRALHDVEHAIELHAALPPGAAAATRKRWLDLHELWADVQQYGFDQPELAFDVIERVHTDSAALDGEAAQRRRMSQISRRAWSGDFGPALDAADELAGGLVPGSKWSLQAVAPAILARTWTGNTTQALAIAERYAPAATAYDASMPRIGAEIYLTTFLLRIVSGRIGDARQQGADPRAVGQATRLDSALTYAGEARLLAAEGRWREADERFQIAHRMFELRDPSGFAAWALAGEAHSAMMVGDRQRAEALCLLVDHTPRRASRAFEADVWSQLVATRHGLGHSDALGQATAMTLWAQERGFHLAELWALDLVSSIDPEIARESGAADQAAKLALQVDAPVAAALVNHVQAIVAGDHVLENAAVAQLASFGRWVPRRATGTPSPLSRRESEIASLVAAGLTSKVIAERLHLSARTVETHVARIYTKLGVNRRDQLAAALRRRSA